MGQTGESVSGSVFSCSNAANQTCVAHSGCQTSVKHPVGRGTPVAFVDSNHASRRLSSHSAIPSASRVLRGCAAITARNQPCRVDQHCGSKVTQVVRRPRSNLLIPNLLGYYPFLTTTPPRSEPARRCDLVFLWIRAAAHNSLEDTFRYSVHRASALRSTPLGCLKF
jgi:hypothetical protein